MARLDPMLGLLLPLRGDDLVARGGGLFESAYTQAGAGPGVPVGATGAEDWRPVVTGSQSKQIDILAIKGGYPDRWSGATFACRLAAEVTEADWRGWSEPNLVTGWTSPSDYQAADWTIFAAAARSDTGEIVVVGCRGGGLDGRAWSYSPLTEAWTLGYNFAANGVPLAEPLAMAEDPDRPGRMLLWSGTAIGTQEDARAYYSDDSGATWTSYATSTHSNLGGASRSSVGVHATRDWLLMHGTRQYGSFNRGITWTEVESISAHLTGAITSIAVGPRGYVVGYLRDTDSQPCVRILISGFTPFSTAPEIVVSAETCENIQVAADDDGVLYAYVWHTADEGHVRCLRSINGGFTWGAYSTQVAGKVSADWGRLFADAAVFSQGQCHLIGDVDGSTNALAMMICGGWSNVDQGNSFSGVSSTPQSRFGWSNESVSTGGESIVYIPADTPANSGWTLTAGGTEAFSLGGLTIDTVATTRIYDFTLKAGSAVPYACGHWRGLVTSGALRSSTGAFQVRMELMDSATTAYTLQLRIGSDGFQVRGLTTQLADLAITTSAPFEIRWFIRQSGGAGKATVWYRIVGSGSKWTRVANDATLDAASALTNNRIRWGVISSGTINVTTVLCGAALNADWRHEIDAVTDQGVSPQTRVRGIAAGKPLQPQGSRYPVPLLGTNTTVGYVHAVGGPVYASDQYGIPPGYQFAIKNLDPLQEPSPQVPWRATDTAAAKLVWDAAKQRWRGGALALVALRASFRQAEIAIDDGAGAWTTLGTLDKGFDVSYTLSGVDVVPAGAETISRFLHENELVGGYFVFATAGSPVARRIVGNTPGYWGTTETPAVRLVVEGTDGTETASAVGQLVCPSAVLLVYPSTQPARRWLRLQIPAGQVVPADGGEDDATAAYGAGKLFAARVVAVGLDPTWQVQGSYDMPAAVTRRRDGSPILARTGLARRSVAYAWPSAPTHPMRDRSSLRDYVGASGGVALAAAGDAWSTVPRVLDEVDGAPLVLVPRLPSAGATLTDPTTFLYGLATAPALNLAQSGGREGADEVIAVGGLRVEEIA